MRKILLTIAMLASLAATAGPRLVWLNPAFDFGAFREEVGPVTCTFMAVNVGDEPAVVVDARANCGCTRPTYTREPVQPGDTLKVSVAYDPNGRPGRFRKQVKITTNAESPNDVLRISGTVIGSANTLQSRYPEAAGPYRLSNTVSPFGETTKGHVLAAAINIYNPTSDTIVPAITDKPGYINVLFSPKTIPPGEQGTASLTAYTDRAEGWGLIEGEMTLLPNSARPQDAAKISTIMIVNEDFSKLTDAQRAEAPTATLSAETIDFGSIDASKGRASQTLKITNNGHSPLIIRQVTSPDKSLTLKLSTTKVKPGHSATLTVTVDPSAVGANEKIVNSRVTIVANDPNAASQIVRVVGEIK